MGIQGMRLSDDAVNVGEDEDGGRPRGGTSLGGDEIADEYVDTDIGGGVGVRSSRTIWNAGVHSGENVWCAVRTIRAAGNRGKKRYVSWCGGTG